jgi:endonuclease/exonuclease/phosphatase (EEP) superfamily protein YafD
VPAFAVILLHPPSPRSVERWLAGNEVVEAAVEMASAARQAGLPVILLADLNSTPTGWRSRRLTQAGFRRCKPLTSALGTWPTHAALNTDGSGLPNQSPPGASTSAFQPDPDDRALVGRWPLSIAIDDAWVSDEWRVTGWSRGPSRGSDHWSVVVDVRMGK